MSGTLFVNTRWDSEPDIFIGTIIDLKEIANGEDLPVLELQIENSFERYDVVMSQPHQELRLTKIPDAAVQLVLWTARDQYAVSRSDTVILLDTPDTMLHLPYSTLHRPDIATDIELFIAQCPVRPLKDFVRRVLGRPSVGIRFMNGAMWEPGYETPGSLAQHSLDVAMRSFDACRGYTDEERWLASIAGLLHGLGCIELTDSKPPDYLKVALKTLGLLSEELKRLEKFQADAARMIQFIIASMYRVGSRTKPHPGAMVVQTSHLVAAHLQSELIGSAKRHLAGSKTNYGKALPLLKD
jgi:hypothetical protein